MARGRSSLSTIGFWPRLTRFYGLSPFDLSHMPSALIWHYMDCLPVIQAEEHLAHLAIADYPHLEQSDRERLHRAISRNAEMEDEAEAIHIDTDAGVAAAAALGITVKVGND